jgi:hypothetical protein
MLFSGGRQQGGTGGDFYKKPAGKRAQRRQQSIGGQLAQDCQRRHSQASRAPVWLTVCFLVKNME